VSSRRWIVIVSVAGALAYVYRKALIDHWQGELTSWIAFVLLWLPASVVLGLAIAYAWPWAVRKWRSRKRQGR
jgi:hypothetical protein